MIGTVRRTATSTTVDPAVAHAVALDAADPAAAIRAYAPGGVDRIVEVALSDNADLDDAVAANGAVIAAYATRADRTGSPSGRCCSTTSPSACSAATTSRRGQTPGRRDLTAAAASAPCVPIGDRYRSTASPRPTTASTPAAAPGASCFAIPPMQDDDLHPTAA